MCRYGLESGFQSSSSWGALSEVVFMGDDIQLPLVCDPSVYTLWDCDITVCPPNKRFGFKLFNGTN